MVVAPFCRRVNGGSQPVKSGWVDRDAENFVADGAASGVGRDLAFRIYTTRLLGRDPKLVLHGGGNTSLKARLRDRLGEDADVLWVKSSGSDMAKIDADGFVAVRLEPMRKLRALESIGDEDLVAIERANLIDAKAANPSVEMMLHAFLPHKFIDHTHATAVLSLIDQPDGEKKCEEVFGRRLGFVPYVMPGFGLAKKAIEVFERGKPSDGLILSKHGIVTFGDTAREAYERMIEMVTLAEEFIARRRKTVAVAAQPHNIAGESHVAPIVRGACSEKDATVEGAWRRLVLEFRGGEAVRNFVNAKDLDRVSQLGVITPDHTIRTKNWPLVLPAPDNGKLDEFAAPRASGRANSPRTTATILRATTNASAASSMSSIPCPASCWCPGSACSVLAAPNAMRSSPPISPRRGSKASAMPKRSANSNRFPRPTCSIANIGRWNRPSSARAKTRKSYCRLRGRLLPSPAPAAPSARQRREFLPRPAPKSRCST